MLCEFNSLPLEEWVIPYNLAHVCRKAGAGNAIIMKSSYLFGIACFTVCVSATRNNHLCLENILLSKICVMVCETAFHVPTLETKDLYMFWLSQDFHSEALGHLLKGQILCGVWRGIVGIIWKMNPSAIDGRWIRLPCRRCCSWTAPLPYLFSYLMHEHTETAAAAIGVGWEVSTLFPVRACGQCSQSVFPPALPRTVWLRPAVLA